MPFVKNEIVPDVIPVAPKEIATVNYVSGVKGENENKNKEKKRIIINNCSQPTWEMF